MRYFGLNRFLPILSCRFKAVDIASRVVRLMDGRGLESNVNRIPCSNGLKSPNYFVQARTRFF